MLGSWYDPKRRKIAEGKILGGGHISIWWALLWILRWSSSGTAYWKDAEQLGRLELRAILVSEYW